MWRSCKAYVLVTHDKLPDDARSFFTLMLEASSVVSKWEIVHRECTISGRLTNNVTNNRLYYSLDAERLLNETKTLPVEHMHEDWHLNILNVHGFSKMLRCQHFFGCDRFWHDVESIRLFDNPAAPAPIYEIVRGRGTIITIRYGDKAYTHTVDALPCTVE